MSSAALGQEGQGASKGSVDTEVQRARTVAEIARNAAKRGNYAAAAQLFSVAAGLDPSEWSYVYSIARAEQIAGRYKEAETQYARFLAGVTAKHPLYAKATKHRAQLPRLIAAAEAAKRDKQRGVPARVQRWRSVGFVTLGVGLAALGAGAWMYAGGKSAQRSLEARMTETNSDSKIVGIDHATAVSEQKRIESELTAGAVGLGIGAVATAGAAALLLFFDNDDVALAPSLGPFRGVNATVRF